MRVNHNRLLKKLRIVFQMSGLVLGIVALNWPLSASATWYTGEGTARIVKGDEAAARQKATEDALVNVLFQAGASVQGVQQVAAGVLQVDSLKVRSNGEINAVEMLNESKEADRITIRLRADVFAHQACERDFYKKTLFVGPISIHKREQGQLGEIYRLPDELSRRLYARFIRDSRNVDPRELMTEAIAVPYQSSATRIQSIKRLARELAVEKNVQYLLFGEIADMSSYNETTKNVVRPDSTQKIRNFRLELTLIDGINNEVVMQRTYSDQAPWPFDITMKLDVAGDPFWNSEYGKIIDRILDHASQDIDRNLYCDHTLSQIVAVMPDSAIIDIGRDNGVRMGDRFKIIHKQITGFGANRRPFYTAGKLEFEVVSVQQDRSLLKPLQLPLFGNIQVRDIVRAED